MKHFKHLFTILLLLCATVATAHDFKVDGIYYNITDAVAKTVAKSVICSSLTKAAMFGADANWGRVLCAIGYSGAKVDVNKIDVAFRSIKGEIAVSKNGSGVEFSE